MPNRYSRQELTKHFFEMLDMFHDNLDTDISKDTLTLDFFTPDNGIQVYEKFCENRFPQFLEEDYKAPGYFESIASQAFLNKTEYGVLVREDIDFTLDDLLWMFLHEISHLYCSRNELDGKELFFDKYCTGSGIEDGLMNAGYAIWREAIADIMADSMVSEYAHLSLRSSSVRDRIQRLYEDLSPEDPISKKAMSLIIVYTMISKEVASTERWETAEKALRRDIKINDELLFAILEQVFHQLQNRPFWRITPDFIMTLGETYESLLVGKLFYGVLTGRN